MRRLVLSSFVIAALVLSACSGDDDDSSAGTEQPASGSSTTTPDRAGFTLTSSAFDDGRPIPTEFTCDGANTSPPLAWQDALDHTKQLALIVDDPDAPSGNFVHWV